MSVCGEGNSDTRRLVRREVVRLTLEINHILVIDCYFIQVLVPRSRSFAKPRQKTTKAETGAPAAQFTDAAVPIGKRLAEPSGRVDQHGNHSEDDGVLASHTHASRHPQLTAREEFR